MPTRGTSSFLANLRASQLLDEAKLQEIEQWPSASAGDDRALALELVTRKVLTKFQAEQVLAGRTQGFFIGSYVVLEHLGSGGMGQVYKAMHRTMQRTVALKVLRRAKRSDPGAQARFMREVRASAQLNHPNIVAAYDVGEHGNVTYLVLEYVPGASLQQLVTKYRTLKPPTVVKIARQVAEALEHARQCGIVHRDIKPSNILVDRKGTVKVLDMGLARFEEGTPGVDDSTAITRDGVVMGTLDYLAPEQALDSHQADTRADIYSLGCTMYHMLTGRVPFPGKTVAEKLMKHQMRDPTPIPELAPRVPPALADVVNKMMAKKPEDRQQTPGKLAKRLADRDLLRHTGHQVAPLQSTVDLASLAELADGGSVAADAFPEPEPPPAAAPTESTVDLAALSGLSEGVPVSTDGASLPEAQDPDDAYGVQMPRQPPHAPPPPARPESPRTRSRVTWDAGQTVSGLTDFVSRIVVGLLKPAIVIGVLVLGAYFLSGLLKPKPGKVGRDFTLGGDAHLNTLWPSAIGDSELWQTYFAHRSREPGSSRPFLRLFVQRYHTMKGMHRTFHLTVYDAQKERALTAHGGGLPVRRDEAVEHTMETMRPDMSDEDRRRALAEIGVQTDTADRCKLCKCTRGGPPETQGPNIRAVAAEAAKAVLALHAKSDPTLIPVLVAGLRRADRDNAVHYIAILGEIGPGAGDACPTIRTVMDKTQDPAIQEAGRQALAKILAEDAAVF